MSKQGEIDFLKNLDEAERLKTISMPFSDEQCHTWLFRIGAIMTMLPPPGARLLDMGCGTGWTSTWFAKRGYDVVGVDIAPDMIKEANLRKEREQLENVRFMVSDYESMEISEEFDCVVFFSSLHHAEDEQSAMTASFQALKPGGVCITSEPGRGHAQAHYSQKAMETYGVTEKEMPPPKIIELGKRAGFKEFRIFPDPEDLWHVVFPGNRKNLTLFFHKIRVFRKFYRRLRRRNNRGLVLLTK